MSARPCSWAGKAEGQHQLVRQIEELALQAWPAAEVQPLDGWQLRFNWGVTQRANSVWPNAAGRSLSLDQKLDRVDSFYREHQQPSLYQICPAAQPADLDAELERRGYRKVAATAVQVAEVATVLGRASTSRDCTVEVAERPDQGWLPTYQETEPAGELDLAIRRGILERITRSTAFALVSLAEQPAGVGLAVLDGQWVGIFCMATGTEFRRRGVATSVLRTLAAWAQDRSAHRLYLQVMHENTPALRLYAQLGFRTAYDYHFRVAP